jgi:hypothetical protein
MNKICEQNRLTSPLLEQHKEHTQTRDASLRDVAKSWRQIFRYQQQQFVCDTESYRYRTVFAATDRCKIFRLWRFLLPQCKRVNKETNTKEQEPMQNDKEVERSRSEVEAKQETSAAK